MNKVEYCGLILDQLNDEIQYLRKYAHAKDIAVSENCPFCIPIVEENKIIGFNCNRLSKLYEFREQITSQIVQYNMRDKLNPPESQISPSE